MEQATAKEIIHEDVEMVRRFGAEFRKIAGLSMVSARQKSHTQVRNGLSRTSLFCRTLTSTVSLTHMLSHGPSAIAQVSCNIGIR